MSGLDLFWSPTLTTIPNASPESLTIKHKLLATNRTSSHLWRQIVHLAMPRIDTDPPKALQLSKQYKFLQDRSISNPLPSTHRSPYNYVDDPSFLKIHLRALNLGLRVEGVGFRLVSVTDTDYFTKCVARFGSTKLTNFCKCFTVEGLGLIFWFRV